jgi:hypothetical protein
MDQIALPDILLRSTYLIVFLKVNSPDVGCRARFASNDRDFGR